MKKLLCGAMLFACCHTSLAAEPAIPVPATFSAVETAPVESAHGAKQVPNPAVPAAAPTTTAAPAPAAFCPPEASLYGPDVWYRPEAVVPPANEGLHLRYPYYSYRRPWYPPGPASVNVTIIW